MRGQDGSVLVMRKVTLRMKAQDGLTETEEAMCGK
jgi:hypothetical protein